MAGVLATLTGDTSLMVLAAITAVCLVVVSSILISWVDQRKNLQQGSAAASGAKGFSVVTLIVALLACVVVLPHIYFALYGGSYRQALRLFARQ